MLLAPFSSPDSGAAVLAEYVLSRASSALAPVFGSAVVGR